MLFCLVKVLSQCCMGFVQRWAWTGPHAPFILMSTHTLCASVSHFSCPWHVYGFLHLRRFHHVWTFGNIATLTFYATSDHHVWPYIVYMCLRKFVEFNLAMWYVHSSVFISHLTVKSLMKTLEVETSHSNLLLYSVIAQHSPCSVLLHGGAKMFWVTNLKWSNTIHYCKY